MPRVADLELPPDKVKTHASAVKLEWVTLVYLVSAVFFIYITLGASQAMKAAWLEDLLSLVPPLSFLIGSRIRTWPPSDRFPYGYHRAVTLGYFVASIALLAMGLFIAYDSLLKLIAFEHTPIGTVQPWGEPIWLGWFMLAALVWSAIPALILGRMKLPLARELHDKVLFADAEMNKADWMTAGAAMIGVIGIGFGLWWLDPIAAIFIALDITHDGWKNIKHATSDLVDKKPTLVDKEQEDPLPARIQTELEKLGWVEEARVRLREEGHVYFGEAFVIPRDESDLTARIEDATNQMERLDWRLHDLVIAPVRHFAHEHPGEGADEGEAGGGEGG
ncbi:MAG: cation diffusion facilitator family transporter [Actinobacteria bacterium]|nr:cation diffusion facilitator family transporter [Actinomycetota bacterium]